MKPLVVAIHGLRNKPPKRILRQWWQAALTEGLKSAKPAGTANPRLFARRFPRRVPLRMVYWADILYPNPQNPRSRNTEDPLFIAEPYVPAASSPPSPRFSWKGRLFRVLNAEINILSQTRNLKKRLDQLTDFIIHRYFADLERYYADDGIAAEAIRERLRRTLRRHRRRPILLIAHSMGSIIAAEVLESFADSIKVDTLITIGSPLGIPAVKSRILENQKSSTPDLKKPRTPAGIRRAWYNLADPEDPVSLDPTLADDYAPNPRLVAVQDRRVSNKYIIAGRRSHHKSFGYLRSPEMAAIVSDFLVGSDIKKADMSGGSDEIQELNRNT